MLGQIAMASHFQFGDFELQPPSRALLAGGAAVAVEPKVFDLLRYLVENRDRAVGRDELIAAVWGRVDVADATLQQAISRLRRVLRETPDAPFVRTVPRHGYQWVAPTQVVTPLPPAPPSPTVPALAAQPPATAHPPGRSARATGRGRVMAGRVVLTAGLVLAAVLVGWQVRMGRHADRPGSPVAEDSMKSVSGPGSPAVPTCAPDLPAARCSERLAARLADTTLVPLARAELLLERARQHLRTSNVAAAVADLDSADGLIEPASHLKLAARALYLRHRSAVLAGRPDEALAFGQRALALYRGEGPSAAYAELLHSLGAAAGRNGELERALTWLTSALQMYDALKDADGAAQVLSTTAYTLSQLGRFTDALAAAHQAQARAGSEANPEIRREALIAVAWASVQTGRLDEAREAVHQALDLASANENPQQAVSLRALLGFIDAAGGRFQKALAAWDEALAQTPEGSQNRTVAGLRLAVVYAALNVGDRERAQSQFEQLQRMAGQAAEFRQSAQHAAALLALADGNDEQAYLRGLARCPCERQSQPADARGLRRGADPAPGSGHSGNRARGTVPAG